MEQAAAKLVTGLTDGDPFVVLNASANGPIVLVCEHASNSVPSRLADQLATRDVIQSHAGWDPGALDLASRLSEMCDAPLVAATISRLVYDLNRSPDAPDAIRTTSEVYDIPGNADLSATERTERVSDIYTPFHCAVTDTIRVQAAHGRQPILVTVHTFSPMYFGKARDVQIGLLHDGDSRFADAIMDVAPQFTELNVQRNKPYSAADGVTHTLHKHAISAGLLNIMIEVRNDLVETAAQQQTIATELAAMLREALHKLGVGLDLKTSEVQI